MLGSYGFELKDMPPILDGERSLTDALAERIEELRAQERYLQHLILFARYAEIVGDDLFETLAFGTSEVDAFAELMRSSPAYADKAIRWESMDDAGLEQLWDELGAIIVDFLGGDDEDPFAHIESTVRRLRAWFCTYFFEIDDLDLLGILDALRGWQRGGRVRRRGGRRGDSRFSAVGGVSRVAEVDDLGTLGDDRGGSG